LEYFVLCLPLLLLASLPRREALQASAAVLLGALLIWGPWTVRNYTSLGTSGDDQQLRYALHIGSYPDFMYQDDPQSYMIPYDYDANFLREDATLSGALTAVGRQFRSHPAKEIYWFLIGKQLHLWSWGPERDTDNVFMYPTMFSPYRHSPPFLITHALMAGLQPVLVLLTWLGCIYSFTAAARRRYSGSVLLSFRAMSLLFLYMSVILTLSPPYVRYSLPLLPVVYMIAAMFGTTVYTYVQAARRRSAVPAGPGG